MMWLLLIAGIAAGDLAIKKYIQENVEENSSKPVLGGHVIITKFYNPGALLGWMKDQREKMMLMTTSLTGVLVLMTFKTLLAPGHGLLKTGYCLLTGGSLSNVYERVRLKKVTDYFRIIIGGGKLKKLEKVIFNLGDIAIFVGELLIMIAEIRPSKD